ncbi:erythromycin esterase family protein [Streptomyces sp. MS19]|uniref:erythromycin esterase family protein n=1 Tax=Streptomyces sp. MS19 TaxID=3385972 RepID=UPI0039A2484A
MATDLQETVHALDATAVMGLFPAAPRVLALGEPTHGAEGLLDMRNDLFRQLVEQHGYLTIALESGCLAGLTVDEYVTTGAGTLDDAVARGITHDWAAFPGNRALVRWMREHNAGRPAAEQVRFAGFDGPLEFSHAESPRQALTALHAYLAAGLDAALLPCTAETLDGLLGADAAWTEPAAMLDPARSHGRSAEATRLRLLADDLADLLETEAPHLLAVTTPDEWDRARLYAHTATGLLRYHFWMADPSPARMARLLGLRARMMADNLLALAARGPVLAFAHNSHFQRPRSTMALWNGLPPAHWWSAGALVGARLGTAYGFVATAVGTIGRHGVGAPPPGTLEGLLHALPQDRLLVNAPALAAALADAPPAPRESPWFGYAPQDPAHLADTDGLAFVRCA